MTPVVGDTAIPHHVRRTPQTAGWQRNSRNLTVGMDPCQIIIR